MKERALLARMAGVDPDPCIVFTSDLPGMVAAHQILGDDQDAVMWLGLDEFTSWIESNNDEFVYHIHFASHFVNPPVSELVVKAKEQYPIDGGADYWQHREQTMWAPLAGRGADHLWKWDGSEPELLEEAFATWQI